MCFYDQYQMTCGDFKWGRCRERCSDEMCGTNLVLDMIPKREKCKPCTKIDTKKRRIEREQDRIRRWGYEHNWKPKPQRIVSIESLQQKIAHLEGEIRELEYQRTGSLSGERYGGQSSTVSSVTTSAASTRLMEKGGISTIHERYTVNTIPKRIYKLTN